MRYCRAARRLAIVSLTAVVSIGPLFGCAGPKKVEIWISPISLSANAAGLEISPQLFEHLVAVTNLSRLELKELGLGPPRTGVSFMLWEDDVQKLLNLDRNADFQRYVDYFDKSFGDYSGGVEDSTWRSTAAFEGFILDAISFGGFDQEGEISLRKSLKEAAEEGKGPEQIIARATAHQLLLEARRGAVRKARGYRQLAQALERELNEGDLQQNVELVVDIGTSARRPTISPLSFVTMRCAKEPGNRVKSTFVFYERRRACDDFGVCRVESLAALNNGPEYRELYFSFEYCRDTE